MRTLPLLLLILLASGAQAANVGPQFQVQVQTPGGTVIDTRTRTWNLSSGTDSVAATVSGSTGRTWTLLNSTDSVAAVQSGTWTTGRTWSLLNSTDSVNAVQSGTWTVQQGTPPWSVSQSGTWTTGRTWSLLNSTDSVNAVQSGTWNINNISGTVSLPTGASTSSNQTNGSQKTQIVDGSGNVFGPTTTISGTNYLPVIQASSATSGSAIPSRATLIAGSDGTNARNLKTDTNGVLQVSLNPVSLSNFFYDDMDVASGGIARGTSFVVGTLTTLYTHSGAGNVYGFTLNLQGLGGAQVYEIDLVLDGNHIFGASGIITSDLLNNALYDISQVTTDAAGFLGWSFPDKAIRWAVPGGGVASYSTSVTVAVKQTSGGAGKFNAGLIALTR